MPSRNSSSGELTGLALSAAATLWAAKRLRAEPVSYTQQPYLPAAPELPSSGGPYLVYLDVWQREVTKVEDTDLADPALAGVDTTTRLQNIWQVKLREVRSAKKHPSDNNCAFGPAASRLTTAPGSYIGLENQLYRIEVHDPGKAGAATFKWSRDNASTVTGVTRLTNLSHIVVQTVGSDVVSGFSSGDLVEITDDALELAGLPGEWRHIKAIDTASRAVTLDAPLSPGLFAVDQNGAPDLMRHMRAERWQGVGSIQGSDTSIDLENGIAVRFDADPADGCFRTGDYWLISALTVNQSFEQLDRAPPRGIHHHFAKLALLTPPDGLRDLRAQDKQTCKP